MGRDVSNHQPDVAPELGALDAVFRLPGGHSEGDLYDQCDRVAEHVIAEGDQNAWLVSQRGCGDETAVPGVGAYCQEVDDAGAELESGLAALCDSARRPRPARRAGIAAAAPRGLAPAGSRRISGGIKRGTRAETLCFRAPLVSWRSSPRGTKPYGFFPLWNPYSSLVNRASPDAGSGLIESGRAGKPCCP